MTGAERTVSMRLDTRELALQGGQALLVIDGGCRIVACGPALSTMLGWSAEGLDGLCVKVVLPELPFSENTPGYNQAYAVFNAQRGVWVRSTALSSQGLKVPVEVALSTTTVADERCIALRVRQPLPAPTLHMPPARDDQACQLSSSLMTAA